MNPRRQIFEDLFGSRSSGTASSSTTTYYDEIYKILYNVDPPVRSFDKEFWSIQAKTVLRENSDDIIEDVNQEEFRQILDKEFSYE